MNRSIDPIKPRQPDRGGCSQLVVVCISNDVPCGKKIPCEIAPLVLFGGSVKNDLTYSYNRIDSVCDSIHREHGELNSGRGSCGLWDSGNPLYHRHCAVLLQVQMQKVQKVL